MLIRALRQGGPEAVISEDDPVYFNGKLIGGTLIDGTFDLRKVVLSLMNENKTPQEETT